MPPHSTSASTRRSLPAVPTDPGVLRSLQSLVDDDGFFAVTAFDHPAAHVLGVVTGDDPSDDDYRAAVEAKIDMVRALAPLSSAVLLDPEMGLAGVLAAGALPGRVGLIANIESQSYQEHPDARQLTDVRPGWDARKIRFSGADGLKLLWRYRHDVPEAPAHRALVERLRAECEAVSLPLIVEPIWVALPGEDADDTGVRAARAASIVDYAHLAAELGADVVKTEFPGAVATEADRQAAAQACRELDAGLAVPWLLLSAGCTFDEFLVQCEIAAKAGACGFIAGRAVWDVAASTDPDKRQAGLQVAAERLARLTATFHAFGRPWVAAAGVDDVFVAYPRHWYTTWHA